MSVAANQEPKPRLDELDERVRTSWGLYRENLAELDGIAYLEAERAEWEHLQAELEEIALERRELKARADAGVDGPPA